MKLLTITSIYYLVFSLMLFLCGGVIFYFQLKNIIDEEVTEALYSQKRQVLRFVKDSARIPQQSLSFDDEILFTKYETEVQERVSDTSIYNVIEEEYLLYRQLVFPVMIGPQIYSATIRKPLFESDDLLSAIGMSLIVIAAVMLILLFLLSRVVSEKIWRPFYGALRALQSFEVGRNKRLNLPAGKVSEFNLLNQELQKMTERIEQDYENLKAFTENAAHESQTPLAVIRSKLDVLLESEKFTPDQMRLIQEMYESLNKLSKLNQSLLLLSKIENRQFHDTQDININTLIANKLTQFDEMIAYKKIRIQKQTNDFPTLVMNSQLAGILFSNLLGNAIKHNIESGELSISINSHSIIISNTGPPLEIPVEKLFERFQKGKFSGTGIGLGLAIVKQICDKHGIKINYRYSEGNHIVSLEV